MNFKHLHYFWRVAKAGGVARASEQQVVRGDGRRDVVRGVADEFGGSTGSEVLQHRAQSGERAHQRRQMALDEYRLAVEGVYVRVGHLDVHEQRQVAMLFA